MDRKYLDKVVFNVDIKLDESLIRETKEEPKRSFDYEKELLKRVLRLVLFLVLSFGIVFSVKYGFESMLGRARGYTEHVTIGKIMQDYNKAEAAKKEDRRQRYGLP